MRADFSDQRIGEEFIPGDDLGSASVFEQRFPQRVFAGNDDRQRRFRRVRQISKNRSPRQSVLNSRILCEG